ncbi:MAG: CvpA family protein [Rickettsiales bacterium]|jgi:membrane protein required for colicin V production|nr:CvpA family protein [Rickettsiales bacterium]
MIFQFNLDLCVVLILLFLSLIGLIRGFLKETVSILNWFGSFYFTSLAKPIAVSLLRNRITTPFLLDIVSNAVLFVFFVILLSLINNYIVSKIGEFIPTSVNRSLGFAFGLLKGVLISMIVLASINILYRSPNVSDPLWLENSIAYRYFNSPDGSVFVGILERIFGDLIKEEDSSTGPKEKPKGKPEERQKLDGKIEDLTKDPPTDDTGIQDPGDIDLESMEDLLKEIAD